jgi:hypothetical protein
MGDAIHDNVGALVAIPGLQLVGGYVTGTLDIIWTPADWAKFPGKAHITIDQGYHSPPVTTAIVRDVESGAWSPGPAVSKTNWHTARPTIYCNRSDLSRAGGVLACGWKGDLWLAYPGWVPGMALPAAPGCNYVAVQNQLDVGGTHDMSVVIDPTWPIGGIVPLTAYKPGSVGIAYDGPQMVLYGTGQDNIVYVTPLDGNGGTAGPTKAVTHPLTFTP